MGEPGSPLALADGVVDQGKKVERRHCGIGGRGAAILRPDQAIEEDVWVWATEAGRQIGTNGIIGTRG